MESEGKWETGEEEESHYGNDSHTLERRHVMSERSEEKAFCP